MADAPIDPRILQDETQPHAQPMTLPTRTLDDEHNASDGEGNEQNDGGKKRRKLNLLKCKQCREARKKV